MDKMRCNRAPSLQMECVDLEKGQDECYPYNKDLLAVCSKVMAREIIRCDDTCAGSRHGHNCRAGLQFQVEIVSAPTGLPLGR
jgi:hypothetical protein